MNSYFVSLSEEADVQMVCHGLIEAGFMISAVLDRVVIGKARTGVMETVEAIPGVAAVHESLQNHPT